MNNIVELCDTTANVACKSQNACPPYVGHTQSSIDKLKVWLSKHSCKQHNHPGLLLHKERQYSRFQEGRQLCVDIRVDNFRDYG